MTKIPSVEERVDEIFNVYSQVDNEYDMYLINAGEAQQKAKSKCSAILTADRTALLTELRDSGLLEEKPNIPVLPARGSKPSKYHKAGRVCGHNDLAIAIKAHINNLINPSNL